MTKIFVSHSHLDSPAVELLLSRLNEKELFLELSQTKSGQDVSSELKRNLKKSNVVLVFLSPASRHSHWVEFEIGAAQAIGKKIIPILLEGENLEIPESLKDIAYIDARNLKQNRVIEEIKKAIGSET